MALIPWDGSPKWRLIFLCMTLLMSWTNFIMVFSIWIIKFGNGGNDVKMHVKRMFLGPSLLWSFMNALTLKPAIYVFLAS
jgi:hypothetical protein